MTEERLQAYVLGELPPEEAIAVAATIAGDPELQRRELGYRAVREGFRQQRVSSLREELLAFDQTLPPPTSTAPAAAAPEPNASKPARPRRPWWPFAVAALFLLTLGGYWMTGDAERDLPGEFFQQPANPNVAAPTIADAVREAEDLYFGGQYAAARSRFTSLLSESDARVTALFYLPHISFQLDEHDLAAQQFAAALATDEFVSSRTTLLRWNAMINRLARGEDIAGEANENWPANYPANDLREALRE